MWGPGQETWEKRDSGPPSPAGPASGQHPYLEKMPPGTLTPILSHSASVYFPEQSSALTLPNNFIVQARRQLRRPGLRRMSCWVGRATLTPHLKLRELDERRGSGVDHMTREGIIGDHSPRPCPLLRMSTQTPWGPRPLGDRRWRLSPTQDPQVYISVGGQGAR